VGNFGAGGATVLLDTDKPYIDQVEFVNAKNFLPDIAIIMLGTNDARTDHFESIDNFVSDYTKLINEIQALESKPKIFLVKPPPIFDNEFELKNENLLDGIIPRIEQIANEEGLIIIDVYAALENHPEYFWDDGVHPSSEGATIIANEVYEAIILSTESLILQCFLVYAQPISALKTGTFFMKRINPNVMKRVTTVITGIPITGFMTVRLNLNPK
jgi:acyl-CoA thioesterase-1